MKSQLDDMNAELDKLAAKSENAKKDMWAKYKQEMDDLRAQSKKANARLDETEGRRGRQLGQNSVELH